jgi:hypothetical protein
MAEPESLKREILLKVQVDMVIEPVNPVVGNYLRMGVESETGNSSKITINITLKIPNVLSLSQSLSYFLYKKRPISEKTYCFAIKTTKR